MTEDTITHVFTVVIQAGQKLNKVELFDFSRHAVDGAE